MFGQAAAEGRAGGEHDHGDNGAGGPTKVASHESRDPCLDVERAEGRLHVPEHGLDLDHEQDPCPGPIGEQIDAAAVAEAVEAHRRTNEPAHRFETALPVLFEECVAGIDEKARITSTTGHIENQASPQGVDERPDRVKPQPIELDRKSVV